MSGEPNAPLPDLEDVRAALTPELVLQWAGIEVTRPPKGDLFGHRCPREYHRQSARAFCINRETGRWTCYACAPEDGKPRGGDLFTVIAEHAGLRTSGEDFRRVLEIAAEIAGVTNSPREPVEREKRRCAQREAQAQRARALALQRKHQRANSILHATAYWNELAMRHEPAERELERRGVGQAVALGLVRFDLADNGSIALPLYTSDGQVANVIRRRLPAYAPAKDDRFRPLAGLWSMGTYGAPLSAIEPRRDVVLTEGFFDALTAAVALRSALAIGARSASDLATIARHAAPRVKRLGGRLLVAAHRDNAGFDGAAAACAEAHRAGLRIRDGTLAIVRHGSSDLNDSWRAGWQPRLGEHRE